MLCHMQWHVKQATEARPAELRTPVRSLRAEDLYAGWLRGTATFESPLGPRAEEGMLALLAERVLDPPKEALR